MKCPECDGLGFIDIEHQNLIEQLRTMMRLRRHSYRDVMEISGIASTSMLEGWLHGRNKPGVYNQSLIKRYIEQEMEKYEP